MRKRLPHLALLSYFAAWFLYFAWFWSRAIKIDEEGNVHAGLVNIWGDWAAHFTMGSSIGYRQLFLTESPFLIGARFSYPFLANFVSGILIRLGVPFFSAFLLPSFIFSCVLVVALYYFFKTLLKTKWLAVIASMIFLLNGGLGFIYFGQDIINSTDRWQTFLNPPHEYTRLDEQHIKWISIIDSMLIPQRAFNLGFPLTLIALTLIYQAVFIDTRQSRLKLVGASIILGLMPIIHTHSFLAAGFILFFWLIASAMAEKRVTKRVLIDLATTWGIIGLVSLSLAVPIYIYFFAEQTQGFIKWYPGWLAREYSVNWLLFWIQNWGITPLLGIVGFGLQVKQVTVHQRWSQAFRWLPFWLLFMLINLILFQPFAWDNTKLLVWASLGIAALAAVFIHGAMQTARKFNRPVRGIVTLIVLALFGVAIASGTIDAYWDLRTDLHTFQMYTAEEMELATWVKSDTNPEAVWLTGDQHNHWLFNLTGRQTIMAYRGWLWTHGYDYLPVEKDVRLMYQNPSQKEVFEKYDVAYVVIGPNEMKIWGADVRQYRTQLQLIKQTANYAIYSLATNQ